MGNNNSSNNAPTDLIDTSNDDIFKVDNINSHGRKHASAKIQVSSDNLCIRQKHRQSLHIPLETIKRYGLDGSMFILECGHRAPLGSARYAFRCKQARHLVDCLDQHITNKSKQLFEQEHETMLSSSSTLTNVSSTSHQHHHNRWQQRRTQSDQGLFSRVSSSIRFSSSSSPISITSRAIFSCQNSEPDLSQNYLPFDTLPYHREEQGQFIAKLKPSIDRKVHPDLDYIEFRTESIPIPMDEENILMELEIPIALDESNIDETSIQQFNKQDPLSCFNHQQQPNSNKINPINQTNLLDVPTTAYVYIDHEKTTTLTEIVNQRLQHRINYE